MSHDCDIFLREPVTNSAILRRICGEGIVIHDNGATGTASKRGLVDSWSVELTTGGVHFSLWNILPTVTSPNGYSQVISLTVASSGRCRQASFYTLATALFCRFPDSIYLEDWGRVGVIVLSTCEEVREHTTAMIRLFVESCSQEGEKRHESEWRASLLRRGKDWIPTEECRLSCQKFRRRFGGATGDESNGGQLN